MKNKYVRNFAIAMGAFVITLAAIFPLLGLVAGWLGNLSTLGVLVSLLPLIPLLFALKAFVNGMRALDELQLRIQLEAMAAALAGVSLVGVASTMLELAGAQPLTGVFYPVIAAMFWGIGAALTARRYR